MQTPSGTKKNLSNKRFIRILPQLRLLTGRPLISLFMKTDFLFVGNLLCVIWEICFILFSANLFVPGICVRVEDTGPPEAFPVHMMMMMITNKQTNTQTNKQTNLKPYKQAKKQTHKQK